MGFYWKEGKDQVRVVLPFVAGHEEAYVLQALRSSW